jgi:hypothetical protein
MTFVAGEIPPGAKPFQPGQSGNPAGRPEGSRNRATVLRRLLEVAATYQVNNGDEHEGTIEDRIAAAQIDKALKGDTFAFKEIMDSVYGKQGTGLDITSGGKRITGIQIVDFDDDSPA